MSRQSTYRRSRRAVPAPLRTIATVTLAWASVAACAIVAEVLLWAEAHPWALLLVGMAIAAVVAVRAARQAMRSNVKLTMLAMPRAVPISGDRSRPPLSPARPAPQPSSRPSSRPPSRPPSPSLPTPRSSAREPVYLGKERIG